MKNKYPNLSASRGNWLGIMFFRVTLFCMGFRAQLFAAYIVTWFYAAFDKTAFRSAFPYLSLRFPGDVSSERKMKKHFHRMIFELARFLLLSKQIGSGRKIRIRQTGVENINAEGGCVMILSHCGCWQTSIALLNELNCDAVIMARPDYNRNLNKYLAVSGESHVQTISTEDFSGGLLEASAALQQGKKVFIMGDRAVDGTPSEFLKFLHGSIELPVSPFMLAARYNVPAVPVFVEYDEKIPEITIRYHTPLVFETDFSRRVVKTQLLPNMQKYAEDLEQYAVRHPYWFFRFGNDKNRNT